MSKESREEMVCKEFFKNLFMEMYWVNYFDGGNKGCRIWGGAGV